MDFARVLDLVGRFCEERRIPRLLVGASSLKAYGKARLTEDLDVLVPEADKPRLLHFRRYGLEERLDAVLPKG